MNCKKRERILSIQMGLGNKYCLPKLLKVNYKLAQYYAKIEWISRKEVIL